MFFLKENLKKNTGIELIKVVNSTTQQANPTKSFYNRIFGPKTVTIITFTGTTYRKNAERQYKTYGEANELMAPGSGSQLANRNNNQLAARSQQLGPRRINNQMRNASGRVIDTAPQGLPAPNDSTTIPEKEIVPNQIVMAAEVFRTADGFQLGDIYNPKTGEIVFTSPKPTTKKVSKTSQKNTLQQLNNLRK